MRPVSIQDNRGATALATPARQPCRFHSAVLRPYPGVFTNGRRPGHAASI